jgi:hypothetical protein
MTAKKGGGTGKPEAGASGVPLEGIPTTAESTTTTPDSNPITPNQIESQQPTNPLDGCFSGRRLRSEFWHNIAVGSAISGGFFAAYLAINKISNYLRPNDNPLGLSLDQIEFAKNCAESPSDNFLIKRYVGGVPVPFIANKVNEYGSTNCSATEAGSLDQKLIIHFINVTLRNQKGKTIIDNFTDGRISQDNMFAVEVRTTKDGIPLVLNGGRQKLLELKKGNIFRNRESGLKVTSLNNNGGIIRATFDGQIKGMPVALFEPPAMEEVKSSVSQTTPSPSPSPTTQFQGKPNQ